jgi:hypothetical protein
MCGPFLPELRAITPMLYATPATSGANLEKAVPTDSGRGWGGETSTRFEIGLGAPTPKLQRNFKIPELVRDAPLAPSRSARDV